MMKKILLVDDHAPTRLMFSKILAQQNANLRNFGSQQWAGGL